MTEFEKMIKAMFAGVSCSCNSCQDCEEIFGLDDDDDCPCHIYSDKKKLWEFANKIYNNVMEKIAQEEDLPFPRDFDEEDVVKIIMEMQ